jgi:hypothetical protein
MLMLANGKLREALEELRQTRMILRSQPRLRVPRSFTLTPESVGVSKQSSAFPILRFATLMTSVLLIVILMGDYLMTSGTTQIPGAMPAQEVQIAMEASPAGSDIETTSQARTEKAVREEFVEIAPKGVVEEGEVMEAEAEGEADQSTAPVEGLSGTPLSPAAEPVDEFAAQVDSIQFTQTAEITGKPQVAGAVGSPAPTQTEISEEELSSDDRAVPTPEPVQPSATQPGLPAGQTQALELEPTATSDAESETVPLTTEMPGPGEHPSEKIFGVIDLESLRLIEAVLAIAAIGTGMAAFMLRRR